MKLTYLGWVVAAALIAVAVGSGFQGSTQKIGVVDATKVFNDSDYAKAQVDQLKALGQARQDMLQFVESYRTFTVEQAMKFHDLSTKAMPTAADKTEIDGIKKAVIAADTRLKDLQTKANPTPAESAELNELSGRVRSTNETAQRWGRDAQDEFDQKRQELNKLGLDKVRDAIKQAASAQGYTLVFITDIAPYGANDLTAETLKVMNKK